MKEFPKLTIISLLELLLFLSFVSQIDSVNDVCTEGLIDAITVLKNGSIVLFRKTQLWILDRNKQLLGPCDVSEVFSEMHGPIEAAVTITSHDTITQFIGSSIYFESGQYLTYKNLGPYQVEWGALVYLPHKGSTLKMGRTVPEAVKLTKRKMSAAYFDPIDKRSKFIFPDGSVLGFTFEFGPEYDKPLISNLTTELKKYGLNRVPASVDAALTLNTNNGDKLLYLFEGTSFCAIKISLGEKDQSCDMKSIKDGFLNCDTIVKTRGFCEITNAKNFEERNSATVGSDDKRISESIKEDFQPVTGRHVAQTNAHQNNTTSQSSSHSQIFSSNGISCILNLFLLFNILVFIQ
jgi:hypothetical protein